MNTRISYMYVDGTNFKKFSDRGNDLIVEGVVTWLAIKPYLHNGVFFIPDQLAEEINKSHGHTEMTNINNFDLMYDHCFHKIDSMTETDEDYQVQQKEFFAIMKNIKWDENYFVPKMMENKVVDYEELISKSIVITPDELLPDAAEKFEDLLVKFLSDQKVTGKILDGITNNELTVE